MAARGEGRDLNIVECSYMDTPVSRRKFFEFSAKTLFAGGAYLRSNRPLGSRTERRPGVPHV